LLVPLLILLAGLLGGGVLILEPAVGLGELGELLVPAGPLGAAGLLGLVEGPAELLDLRAELAGLAPELIAFGPEPVGLAAERLHIPRLLPYASKLLVAAGEFLPVGLLGPLEGLAEVLDLRAEPMRLTPKRLAFGLELIPLRPQSIGFRPELIGFRPETIALLLARPLVLGERGAEAFGLVRGILPIERPLLLLGAGPIEFRLAMLEQFLEAVELAPGRVEVGVAPLRLLLRRARLRGLLPAEGIDLAPELIELGGHRGPLLRQVPNRVRRESSEVGADRLQLGRDLDQPLLDPIVVGLEPGVFRLELIMLVQEFLALASEQALAIAKLLVLGRQALVLDLELFSGGVEPQIRRDEPLVLGVRRLGERLRNGRGRIRLRLRRGCDGERVSAMFALDRLADVLAPDAQALVAVRAGHDDPILLGPGLDRRAGLAFVGGWRGRCGSWGLLHLERLIALLATDRLAEVNPPDLQLSRTVGTDGDEMRLGIAHGTSFPCERADRAPISP
jgi:hypothetical protein